MADYDVTLTPVKRASFDAGRKMKFWTSAAGGTGAVVKDLDDNTLEAGGDASPAVIKVPSNGHLDLRFTQWPVYYSDNRAWTKIKRVPGMPASITTDGLTQAAVEAAIGTGGNLDTTVAKADIDDAGTIDGTEIAAMFSADHTRINAISAKVDAILAKLKTAGVIADS